jgi:hypothetical protein
MRRGLRVACIAMVAAGFARIPDAVSQDAPAAAGYEIERSQSVQNAPAGWVGRKTTDRERRVGKTKDTSGKEQTYLLTLGGFARRCPSADGSVEGNFEYALTYDAVDAAGGAMQQTRQVRRLAVRLNGHVGDDARLERVEMEGDFTVEKSGTGVAPSTERRPVRTTFRPGASGEPDYDAMRTTVETTADVATASGVLMAGTLYRQAEAEWLKMNACVEFAFEPPSDLRSLRPTQSTQVRVTLRTKERSAPVPWKTEHIDPLQGAGSVSPRRVQVQPGEPATLTYTASSRPQRGNGFGVASFSRAGAAGGEWRIVEPARFEGRFTQTDSASMGSGLGTANDLQKVSGTLVWTPEEGTPPSAPTFGDVRSSFFRPSAGEITVELENDFQGLAGSSCKHRGRKSFPIDGLPASMLRFFLLEVADDGRYKLSLGLPDRVWQVWKMEVESVCTFPSGQVVRDSLPVNQVAVQIGVQQGRLNADQGVVGELAAPIRRGPRTISGNWSFARKTD